MSRASYRPKGIVVQSTGNLCTSLCACSLSPVWLLQPRGLSPARLLCSWDFPDKNTVVGYRFLLQGIIPTQGPNLSLLHLLHSLPAEPPRKPLVLQPTDDLLLSHFSRVQLCDPIDGSPPGSPVHGIFQARVLEWVAIAFSDGTELI